MTQADDDHTGYGRDQDREPPLTAMSDEWQRAADRNPDDFPEPDEREPDEGEPDEGEAATR